MNAWLTFSDWHFINLYVWDTYSVTRALQCDLILNVTDVRHVILRD